MSNDAELQHPWANRPKGKPQPDEASSPNGRDDEPPPDFDMRAPPSQGSAADECEDEPLSQEDIDQGKALRRAQQLAALEQLIGRFNARYAVVNEAGKAIVYEQTTDPVMHRKVLTRIGFADLQKFYRNTRLTITKEDGKRVTKTEADWWLSHKYRRQYLGGVVFDPTGDAPPDYWNLWSGFAVTPTAGDWGLVRNHIFEVLCGRNDEHCDYVLDWTARMFQYPSLQGEVALVIRGPKGCGKGIFFQCLRSAWGQHGVYVANAKHLVGNFNGHLRDCVFLFADEAFFAGDFQHESVLKALITEPVLAIEGKYQNAVNIINMLHIGMASNSDWVVPASHDERRYAVLNASDHRCGDKPYFKAIETQLHDGGLAAFIHDMLNRDITNFDVRDFPQTQALAEQKRHSIDSLHRWWLAVLERGFLWKSRHGAKVFREWQEIYSTELLFRSYLQWCDETRPYDGKSRVQLGEMMTRIYKATRPRKTLPIYELDSIDMEMVKMGKTMDDASVVWQDHAMGYRVDDIEQASARFADITGIIVGQSEIGHAQGDDI
jgi:Family of unknown function (DUF5906)